MLFTDGVSEAFSPTQELFGEERLLAQLAQSPGEPPRRRHVSVLDAVRASRRRREAVRRHHGRLGPLCLRRLAGREEPRSVERRVQLDAVDHDAQPIGSPSQTRLDRRANITPPVSR